MSLIYQTPKPEMSVKRTLAHSAVCFLVGLAVGTIVLSYGAPLYVVYCLSIIFGGLVAWGLYEWWRWRELTRNMAGEREPVDAPQRGEACTPPRDYARPRTPARRQANPNDIDDVVSMAVTAAAVTSIVSGSDSDSDCGTGGGSYA